MRRLLIKIGTPGGFLEHPETDFEIRVETDKLTKEMIKTIMKSLEEALLQEV